MTHGPTLSHRARFAWALLLLTLCTAPAVAQTGQPSRPWWETTPTASPDSARLRRDVQTLVNFGTRHTLSDTNSRKRGIGAARRWAAAQLAQISRTCDGCITVSTIGETKSGPRAPHGVWVENVLGIQRGTGDPNRVVIIAAHIDSRASDVMNATIDAPGANDDGSGTALVLEAARLMSRTQHDATIVYAILSGEEQGLWGGAILANHARAQGWAVMAMLNNDIVGGTRGTEGQIVDNRVRVFSEGIRFADDQAAQRARRSAGGEDDGPSRALAKKVWVMAPTLPNPMEVLVARRPDRFSRGGDHLPALELGFPAIRFTAGVEDYDAQHQDVRTDNGRKYGDTIDEMDFAYLARVTALNVRVASDLAHAPLPPAHVYLDGAVSSNTTVRWDAVPGVSGYRIMWRRHDEAQWQHFRDVGSVTQAVIEGVVVDDHFFGVKSLSASGAGSLVTFGEAVPKK